MKEPQALGMESHALDNGAVPNAKRNPWLPWVTFLIFPVPACLLEVFIMMGMSFYYKDAPFFLVAIGMMVNFTTVIIPAVWLGSLVNYFRKGCKRHDYYARLPLLVYGVHVLCLMVLWMVLLLCPYFVWK